MLGADATEPFPDVFLSNLVVMLHGVFQFLPAGKRVDGHYRCGLHRHDGLFRLFRLFRREPYRVTVLHVIFLDIEEAPDPRTVIVIPAKVVLSV